MADSAVLTIGPEKITNLRAAILSDHKIRLNWDPIDHKDKQIRWALLRNGVEIALLDDVHSFEDHVESDQVYIYRVIAFMQDKDPFYREFPGAKDADTFIKQEHSIFYSAPLIISTEKSDDFKQSSFIFRTYLLSKDVVDSDDVQKNSDEYYISIHEKERSRSIVQSSITPWEGSTPVEMLKGLIDVEVNGYSLVSSGSFDNVRMLWDYLLTMVEEYIKAAQATIYFPNRPIPIALKRQSPGMIEFQIGDRFVTIGEKKCLCEILHGAEHFFTLLNEVSPNRYSLLLEQIEALQGQVQSMGQQEEPVVELGIKAERISLNRILLSWMPNANQNVRKYEILLDNAFVISLPANETSYTHLFQPTDKLGKCIYKLISYDADDKEIARYSVEIDIDKSYLAVTKVEPPAIELEWAFPEQQIPLISYYKISRDGISLDITDSTSYTDRSFLPVGRYNYQIEALDSSMNTLAVEPVMIEKTASNSIELNWVFSEEDIPSISYYNIHCNGINLGVTNSTTCTRTLRSLGAYTYEIKALDYNLKALDVDVLVKKIDVVPGDIPATKLVIASILHADATRISVDQIRLSWHPIHAQNIKKYAILLEDGSLIELASNEKSYTHTIKKKR